MRFPAIAAALLSLAGGGYYFVTRHANSELGVMNYSVLPPQEGGAGTTSRSGIDSPADAHDAELIRQILQRNEVSEDQTNTLIGAAGRRYMRRKLAYAEAKQ